MAAELILINSLYRPLSLCHHLSNDSLLMNANIHCTWHQTIRLSSLSLATMLDNFMLTKTERDTRHRRLLFDVVFWPVALFW